MLIFAGLVGCGVMIRVNLKPFVPAFMKLVADGASEEVNDALAQSLNRCRPWVWAIWAGLLVNTAIGIHLL
jgi:hypothetical protein